MAYTPQNVNTLKLIEDFISPDEERDLVAIIELGIPDVSRRKTGGARNVIQRWGSSIPYRNDIVSDVIPAHFQVLINRLVAQQLVTTAPDSVTLNQYLKKQAIFAHVDAIDGGEVITVLSLKSPAVMQFRHQHTGHMFTVNLPARSLVQISDEIRYNWTHEILPVENTRYSLVFRNSQECQNKST